jgi:tetratricopeptide (TPR) repeat protein
MCASATNLPATGPEPRRERPPRPPLGRGRSIRIALYGLAAAILLGPLAWFATRFDPIGRVSADFDRRQYRAALRSAEDYLRWSPNDRRASLMAARCLTWLGRAAEAEAHYRKAGPLEPDDAQKRALGLLSLDQPARAAEVYERILASWPDDSLALKRLAAVRMGMKQWRMVLELADRLIRIPAEEVAGRTLMAIAHHELKHYETSVAAARRVLELDPDLSRMPLPRPLFWNNLALDLMAQGRDEEARGYLEQALARSEDAGLMELLGLSYSQQGSTDQAERYWRRAERLDPGNADVCLDLGRLAMSRRRWDEAIGFLTRAAERSPKAVEPFYNLSQVYRMRGNRDEADRYRRLADQRRQSQPAQRGGMGEDADPDDPTDRMTAPRPESVR